MLSAGSLLVGGTRQFPGQKETESRACCGTLYQTGRTLGSNTILLFVFVGSNSAGSEPSQFHVQTLVNVHTVWFGELIQRGFLPLFGAGTAPSKTQRAFVNLETVKLSRNV